MHKHIMLPLLFLQPLFFVHCSNDSGTNELPSSPSDTLFIAKLDTAFGCLDVQERQFQTFREATSWIDFWDQNVSCIYSDGKKVESPEIDFENNMIIGVFWGAGPSGCRNFYETIQSIYVLQDSLFLYLDETGSLGTCLAEVHPHHLAILEKNNYPIIFVGPLQSFF